MSEQTKDRHTAHAGSAYAAAPGPLTITRDFSASRERVWQAWTSPDAIIKWYGPGFYPAAIFSGDILTCGTWRACLRSGNPDDVNLWQSGKYLVVMPHERLEFTFAWETPGHEDGPGVETHVIVLFEELPGGNTRMHFSQTGLLSAESSISHAAGWNGTFDRLAEFLIDTDRRSAGRPTPCARL